MNFEVMENLTLKTGSGDIKLCKGQAIKIQPEKVARLVESGKLRPVAEEPQFAGYELAERMAIMGENCEPDQIKPYVAEGEILVIPFNSDPKYHYWKLDGQSVCDTLKELGRCDLIPKYKSFYGN